MPPKTTMEKPSSLWYLDRSSGILRSLESMETLNTLTADQITGDPWSQIDTETLHTGTFSGTLIIHPPLTTSQVYRIFGLWPAISHFFANWRQKIIQRKKKI